MDINESSWNYRIEQLLKKMSSETIETLEAQTSALNAAIAGTSSGDSAIADVLADQLAELQSIDSKTIDQGVVLGGQLTALQSIDTKTLDYSTPLSDLYDKLDQLQGLNNSQLADIYSRQDANTTSLINKLNDLNTVLLNIEQKGDIVVVDGANAAAVVYQPTIPNADNYTTFELIALLAVQITDATVSNRTVNLDLYADTGYTAWPDTSTTAGTEPKDTLFTGISIAAVPASTTRWQLFAKDANSNSFNSAQLPSIPIPFSSPIRWRIRTSGTIGAGDVIRSVWIFKLTKEG